MMCQKQNASSPQAGFSMVELLVAIALLIIIIGSVMAQVTTIHKRSLAESSKMDNIQEAREAVDQLTRDLHQAGYPTLMNYDPNAVGNAALSGANWFNDPRVALRLVAIGPTWIFFEGDVDGSGQVSVVRYRRVDASQESTRCPCIERAQSTPKITANPFLGQPVTYHVIAENVSNFAVTAYDQSGNQVGLGGGLNMNANFATVDGTPTPGNPVIKTIAATLTVQSPNADLASKMRPSSSVSTIVELKN
jgi:Tfp pilus assembly protein PilW